MSAYEKEESVEEGLFSFMIAHLACCLRRMFKRFLIVAFIFGLFSLQFFTDKEFWILPKNPPWKFVIFSDRSNSIVVDSFCLHYSHYQYLRYLCGSIAYIYIYIYEKKSSVGCFFEGLPPRIDVDKMIYYGGFNYHSHHLRDVSIPR